MRNLGVSHLLEGSVRKSRNRLRISAKLVQAYDSSQLWSETYDRNLEDVFKIQDEIAEAVVAQLRVTMLGTSMRVNETTDPAAYADYLRATAFDFAPTLDAAVRGRIMYKSGCLAYRCK